MILGTGQLTTQATLQNWPQACQTQSGNQLFVGRFK
eukprot:SAG11_NODE_999_length_6236_cov_3.256477_2_plen_36_part_00